MAPIRRTITGCLLTLLMAQSLQARPITFAGSTTVMADYREGAMTQVEAYYAPTHRFSFGLSYEDLSADSTDINHTATHARLNLLLKRWNLPGAQANIFGWAGAGTAHIGQYTIVPGAPPSEHDHGGTPVDPDLGIVRARDAFSYNFGGQIDFETRRFYTSFKTDFFDSTLYWHRADTLQFGIAPYLHDTNTLATWLIVSGRKYSGDMHQGSELAFMLRLFKKASWFEAGATTEGRLQAMAMFSF